MRIALAGISHETNTYCRGLTTTADFYVLRGERLLATTGQESDIGGAVSACLAHGADPIPILYASAQPSATIEQATYAAFRREIVEGLARAGPLDGVVLCLHGAGVVEGIEDLEADLAQAVRTAVGPDVPIAASFDLHGNVSQAMADALDGVFACHHYPHIDLHEVAAEAVACVVGAGGKRTARTIHVEQIPMLMPTTTTFEGPGKRWLEHVLAAESLPGVLDVSWFHGFPYTDVAHPGTSIVVTTQADGPLAHRVARELGRALWAERESFRPTSLDADAAVVAAQAAAAPAGAVLPVVINETSDNCGGGAPGDGTHLLRAMLAARLEGACFGFLVDRESAAAAHAAGVGATIDLALGGRYDELHGAPLPVRAYVKALHDGRITLQAMFRGAPLNLGPLARLVVDGMDVIVASRRSQTFDPEPFLAVGIDVRRYRYVALKSSNHFRAGFRDIAGTIVTADPPGLTTHHIEVFPRTRARVPLWPIDPAARYE
ncbi:MAG: M81 family metallopeptidase [Pseudomonadales bacterium]|nr:M81 family metallopeptidase [Pseudomonadales bacterium]